MAQYCHASHEVYHEGVAQRAHNLSPVPFGAAKATKESSYHCSDTASQKITGIFSANRPGPGLVHPGGSLRSVRQPTEQTPPHLY